jgi:hypothetical protein
MNKSIVKNNGSLIQVIFMVSFGWLLGQNEDLPDKQNM